MQMNKDVIEKLEKLRSIGVYCATRAEGLDEIINMEEWELEDMPIDIIEEFMNRLSQHIIFLFEELNTAKYVEHKLGTQFKLMASPVVRKAPKEELSGRSSVEERWIYASLQSDELRELFNDWQEAIGNVILMSDLPQAYTEKLNVLKKVHASRTKERRELTQD